MGILTPYFLVMGIEKPFWSLNRTFQASWTRVSADGTKKIPRSVCSTHFHFTVEKEAGDNEGARTGRE